MNVAIEQVKEELKRRRNEMPAAEFHAMVDLIVKASALAWIGLGKPPEKFYKDGFTFLKAGKGYVVVKTYKGP